MFNENRAKALNWWNKLSKWEQIRETNELYPTRNPNSLTGREIEKLHKLQKQRL